MTLGSEGLHTLTATVSCLVDVDWLWCVSHPDGDRQLFCGRGAVRCKDSFPKTKCVPVHLM